jgi:hypothetical protein
VKLKRGTPPRLVFTSQECAVLIEVLQAVKDEISGSDATDPVIERLFPAAYDDASAAGAFRELTENDLRESRVMRLIDSSEELDATEGRVPLTADAADRWIRVLNDARLVLGTRLEITEEWDHDIRPDDPQVSEKAVYLWLTAVQETVVQSLL